MSCLMPGASVASGTRSAATVTADLASGRRDGLYVRCATSYQKQNDRQACGLTRSHHFF
jgi:hypothetical protein